MKVTLESKFDIGDQVYIVSTYCGRITETTIVNIRFSNSEFLYTTVAFPNTFLEERELSLCIS